MKITITKKHEYMSGWTMYDMVWKTDYSELRRKNMTLQSAVVVTKEPLSTKILKAWAAENGVDIDALFTDDLYFRISRHAIALAEELKKLFTECGLPFALNSPTNQQFIILENARMEALREKVRFGFWEKYDDTHTVVRFATGWSTTEEDISTLRNILLSC